MPMFFPIPGDKACLAELLLIVTVALVFAAVGLGAIALIEDRNKKNSNEVAKRVARRAASNAKCVHTGAADVTKKHLEARE